MVILNDYAGAEELRSMSQKVMRPEFSSGQSLRSPVVGNTYIYALEAVSPVSVISKGVLL